MNIDSTQRRKSKPSVLVVDDDPKLRRLVERQLSAEGFDVLLASNGEEALYQASLSRPSLIVLDISMPVMDGFQFVEAMRQNPAHEYIPIVVLTAKELIVAERGELDLSVGRIIRKGDLSKDDLLKYLPAEVSASLQKDGPTQQGES